MKNGWNYRTLLTLALSFAPYAVLTTHAQAQSKQAAPTAHTMKDYQSQVDALKATVPASELQTFASDLTTLVHVLHDLNPTHQAIQDQMTEAEQKIAAMTPEQLTVLANSWDRPALSKAVAHLRRLMPGVSAPGAADGAAPFAGPTSNAISVVPKALDAAADPSQTNTLTLANYGPCTPSPAPTFLGAATPIPSDTNTDYGLFIGLSIANAAQIPLNFLCQEITVILGEGTNIPECIIAAVDQAIAFALQTTLQVMEFCDANVLAAENDAAYFNTIAIFNNLGTDTAAIETQLTSTQNEIDNHITSVDSDLNAHITSIDSDINNHIAAINTNVNGNVTAITTAINTQVAATDVDIDTRLANVDTDLNKHLTGVDTDINAHLSAVDADVLASASQLNGQISTLQALDVRIEIEQTLSSGLTVGIFETPKSQGGYLEVVGTTVQTVITGLVASGQGVSGAQVYENQGNTAFSAGQFKAAYQDYLKAYQTAVR